MITADLLEKFHEFHLCFIELGKRKKSQSNKSVIQISSLFLYYTMVPLQRYDDKIKVLDWKTMNNFKNRNNCRLVQISSILNFQTMNVIHNQFSEDVGK